VFVWLAIGNCCRLAFFPLDLSTCRCANVRSYSWFVGHSLSKSEHTVIDLGHGGAPRLVSFTSSIISNPDSKWLAIPLDNPIWRNGCGSPSISVINLTGSVHLQVSCVKSSQGFDWNQGKSESQSQKRIRSSLPLHQTRKKSVISNKRSSRLKIFLTTSRQSSSSPHTQTTNRKIWSASRIPCKTSF
jgi:hypothetical protein